MGKAQALPASLFFPAMVSVAWGLQEVVAGYILRASPMGTMSGSVLGGLSCFFLAAGYALRPSGTTPLMLMIPLCVTGIAAAALRGAAWSSGPVFNPLLAACTEAGAFFLVARLGAITRRTPAGQSAVGAASALLAVLIFPAAGLITGTPVCTLPGSSLPVSIAYGPLAMVIAALVTPAGLRTGAALRARVESTPHLSGGFGWMLAAASAANVILLAVAGS